MAKKTTPTQTPHEIDCMQSRKSAGALHFYQIEAENLKLAIRALTEHTQKAKNAFLTINPHQDTDSARPEVYQTAI